MRRIASAAGLAGLSAMALAGCSPTYGTDKTANQQLVEDVTGILSLGPSGKRTVIDYRPRPELVKPQSTAVLPPPQDDVTASANGRWPESPEARLRRIRDEASSEQGLSTQIIRDGSGREQVVGGDVDLSTPGAPRAEFKRRLAQQNQGDPNVRRTLSEPPGAYRQPAATAPTDELGEPEWQKEREARRKAGGKKGFRDYLPW